MLTTTGKLTALAILAGLVAFALIAASGCSRMIDLDRQVWEPLTQTAEDVAAGRPTPVLEIIAAGLALAGFGGMAAWIRRNKRHADKNNRKDTPA